MCLFEYKELNFQGWGCSSKMKLMVYSSVCLNRYSHFNAVYFSRDHLGWIWSLSILDFSAVFHTANCVDYCIKAHVFLAIGKHFLSPSSSSITSFFYFFSLQLTLSSGHTVARQFCFCLRFLYFKLEKIKFIFKIKRFKQLSSNIYLILLLYLCLYAHACICVR